MPNTVLSPSNKMLHVAVGVIRDAQENILITRRAKHTHQGGLWEFPGGKLENTETVLEALSRELLEEVAIQIESARPLIKIQHDYPDRRVLLDVWEISRYTGTASANEGQAMRWVRPERLAHFNFPEANSTIIKAAQLPGYYAILEGETTQKVLDNFSRMLKNNIRLVQIRLKNLASAELQQIMPWVLEQCRQRQIIALHNSDIPGNPAKLDGIHLTSLALLSCRNRPKHYAWVAASCHNLSEIRQAEKLGVDFVVLAPVQATLTHPGAPVLGWEGLANLIAQTNLPVYALGGLSLKDFDRSRNLGAQGLAGISAFLEHD